MIRIIYIKESYKDLVEDSELLIHGNLFKVIEIKTGGMGKVVFCKKEIAGIAEDYFLPEYVALKAVHEKLSDKPTLRSSFKRELINWSQIDYKGFARLIGIGVLPSNDGYVAITDLYDGNLRNLIHRGQCRQHKNKRLSASINYSNLEKYLSFQDKLIIINSITSSIYMICTTELV